MSETEQQLSDRKLIYQARRGLKELDYFIDPYIRRQFSTASVAEKQVFAELLTYEDPDLLDWFMQITPPPNQSIEALIDKMRRSVHD